MENFINKIKNSFINSSKGQERFSIIIWGWGVISYIAIVILTKLIRLIDLKFLYISIAFLVIFYLIWHIFVCIKCFPKSPKLSKEEKEQLKLQRGGVSKVFFRKLFLQEPITKMNPRNILIAIDLYFILYFYSFIS